MAIRVTVLAAERAMNVQLQAACLEGPAKDWDGSSAVLDAAIAVMAMPLV